MSYFLIEYNFGSAVGASDEYTAVTALPQSSKITLQNDFMGCMYQAASFKIANTNVSEITSSHAQASVLKKRLGLSTEFIESMGDLGGFDPDFSRRLAKSSSDGVYHRDGLIDCSPYNSEPLGALSQGQLPLLNQEGQPLPQDGDTGLYIGTTQNRDTTFPTTGVYAFIQSSYNYGEGDIAWNAADAAEVRLFNWQLPDNSGTRTGTPSIDEKTIDASVLLAGDTVKFYTGDTKASDVIDAFEWTIVMVRSTTASNAAVTIVCAKHQPVTLGDIKLNPAFLSNANEKAGTGIVSVRRNGQTIYQQADPRSNVVNNMVVYQPPLSVFGIHDPTVFRGDMTIQMTPDTNWRQSAIESSNGKYYGDDVKHGTDYCFGIKSMRLYIARCKVDSVPQPSITLAVSDMLVANKPLPNGASNIDFIIPPSTSKVIVWIQDTSAGFNSKIPLTRFKTRQTTSGSLAQLNQFGPWAHTYDERLTSLQVTFAGITKPHTNFQRGSNTGSSTDMKQGTVNTMLQRWLMTNQNNNNRSRPEKFHDYLSMGAYYLFDFTKDTTNTGTYLQVKLQYDGSLPGNGETATDTSQSTVNLYVCSIYERDIGITYGSYGNVISAATQMA